MSIYGSSKQFELDGADEQLNCSIAHLKNSVPENGYVSAGKSEGYIYSWPRDSSIIARVLDDVGQLINDTSLNALAENICYGLKMTQSQEGWWHQRYWPDGTVGPNWADIQKDQTALAIIAITDHYKHTDSIEFLNDMWGTVKNAADFLLLEGPSFDLWEEVLCNGHYFTTQSIIRALRDASYLAETLNHTEKMKSYREEVSRLEKSLGCFINNGSISCSVGEKIMTLSSNKENTDASIIGAHVLFDGKYINNPLIKKTSSVLVQRSSESFNINEGIDSVGIMRYGGDDYDGFEKGSQGNPWNITTLWMAQKEYMSGNLSGGDNFFNWVLKYMPKDGTLPEQVHRDTGKPHGEKNLMWSHAEYIKTYFSRMELGKNINENHYALADNNRIDN